MFLAYASPKGRALVDRELYLPRSWTGDGQRLAAAGVPEGTGFRTKPQLLRLMIERAATAGFEAHGGNGPLRAYLEERGIAYVLAVARAHVLTAPAGRHRADALAAKLPGRTWQRLSCGDGPKASAATNGRWSHRAGRNSLLIRRSVSRPSELAFYRSDTPRPVPLSRLVKIAGARWAVEVCFQAAKKETGMDHYQVRRYESWYRYITLAMLALAFLAVSRAVLADDSTGLTSSANEIRRMFTALCAPPSDEEHARLWSRWRHRHQERARRCRYQHQRLPDH